MRLVFEGALWPIPRPHVWVDWELRTVELGVSLSNGHTDDIAYVGIKHDLSDRQLDLLDRFYVKPRERRRQRQRVRFPRPPRPPGAKR